MSLPTTLTARANERLEALGARVVPERRASHRAVREAFAADGITLTAAMLEAEDLLGGLEMDHLFDPAQRWRLGLYAMHQDRRPPRRVGRTPDGAPLLTLAPAGGGDMFYLLAPDGSIWFQDYVAMPRPVPRARSARLFLERELRLEDPKLPARLDVTGHHGAALAAALRALPVPEASDDIEQLWESPGVEIRDSPDWQSLHDPVDDDPADPGQITEIRCAAGLEGQIRSAAQSVAPGARIFTPI